MRVALSQDEKKIVPKLKIHHNATELNEVIKQTHKDIRLAAWKAKKIADGTYLGKKEWLKQHEKNINDSQEILNKPKARGNADTSTLRVLLKVMPPERTNVKRVAKILKVSPKTALDALEFCRTNNLVHRCGINTYRRLDETRNL